MSMWRKTRSTPTGLFQGDHDLDRRWTACRNDTCGRKRHARTRKAAREVKEEPRDRSKRGGCTNSMGVERESTGMDRSAKYAASGGLKVADFLDMAKLRTFEEELANGVSLAAKSMTGQGKWKKCVVKSFERGSGLYTIQTSRGEYMKLARTHILFDAEDQEIFATTVKEAYKKCEVHEKLVFYRMCLESIPCDNLDRVNVAWLQEILRKSICSLSLRDQHSMLDVMDEINAEYMKSINKVLLETNLDDIAEMSEFLSDFKSSYPAESIVSVFPELSDSKAVLYESAKVLQNDSYLTSLEALDVLSIEKSESYEVSELSFFSTDESDMVEVSKFQNMQLKRCASISDRLLQSWIPGLQLAIQNACKGTTKSWLSSQECRLWLYESSKMKRFLTLLRIQMEDTVRGMVLASLQRYVCYMEAQRPSSVHAGTNGIHGCLHSAFRKPAFLVYLVTDKGELSLNPGIDSYGSSFMDIFETMVSSSSNLPQLEPLVMEHLLWEEPMALRVLDREDPEVVSLRQRLLVCSQQLIDGLQTQMAKLSVLDPIVSCDAQAYLSRIEQSGKVADLEYMKSEIYRHLQDVEAINVTLHDDITAASFCIRTAGAKEALLEKKNTMIKGCEDLLLTEALGKSKALNKEYEAMSTQLTAPTSSPEDIQERHALIQNLPITLQAFQNQTKTIEAFYQFLFELKRPLSDENFAIKSESYVWPLRVFNQVQDISQMLREDLEKYKGEQKQQQIELDVRISELSEHILSILDGDYLLAEADHSIKIGDAYAQLTEVDELCKTFNNREEIFSQKTTDYSKVRKLVQELEPHYLYWKTASDWATAKSSWLKQPFHGLDPVKVEEGLTEIWEIASKLETTFAQRKLERYTLLCISCREEVETFRSYCTVLSALRSDALRKRHWVSLASLVGIPMHDSDPLTLQKLIQAGFMKLEDQILDVCSTALKEFGIEQALDRMVCEWDGVLLTVVKYRESGTFVIKVEDSVTQQLDDHIVMTQAMGFSPYKGPFEAEIQQWEKKLALISEVLDEWIALQKSWMYLEPIFTSDDIMQQLPVEGKKFAQVNQMWRKTLDEARVNNNLLSVCSSNDLLESFRLSNETLERVQKGLADYLETKRLAFSRFFFLSNDELLQILSQTRNPRAVQPHLHKCFEAIESLVFEEDQKIVGMRSKEQEVVPFNEHMYPEGSVENWLCDVERIMRSSIREQILSCLDDFHHKKREEWVRSWPAMCVLAANSIIWTERTEQAIADGNLEEWYAMNIQQLDGLADLLAGDLSHLDRLTIGALIVHDVHARDVIQRLIDENVSSAADFEWISQLRYYWEDGNVYVKMVQACLQYGYEYLGNQPRLVITPLTDRCYMTLMSAMHLNLGGAPAGPAGTGKTETTKDLAKALAKQCVVFNCSDGLDYIAMGKFFKGLAASGAWACFDEFNRIDLEVLSVIAQQILTIQMAIQQKVEVFTFEGTEIKLNPSCAVFITMNPGYAGRSELPDNLSALFRPCAMMVPDYGLIAEISLMSFGFKNARHLAKKMVATFKLCSEQLSNQDHYDYGMRAVKAVITAAGNLKRENPGMDEESLLLRGLRDVNVPKFLSHDIPLFEGIISDLFPGIEKSEVNYTDLIDAIRVSCREMNLQATSHFISKVIQLYDMTQVRHGMMLVGPTGGGKTSCYRILARALNYLAETKRSHPGVKMVVLNPKSVTLGQLYGDFDEATHEWTDGLLACYMREFAEDTSSAKKWIIFDGPVDAIWIENMNTVLDDNKKLCLVSGEIIQLTSSMSMIFEVEDLAVASPATVSRCGMIYMEPDALGLEPLFQSWLDTLPKEYVELKDRFMDIFTRLVLGGEGILAHIRKHSIEIVNTVDSSLVSGLCKLMGSLIKEQLASSLNNGEESQTMQDNVRVDGLPLFLFSMIWSICNTVDQSSRAVLEQFVRLRINDLGLECYMPPTDGSMYDYFYGTSEHHWMLWMEKLPQYTPKMDGKLGTILVPTLETVSNGFILDKLLKNGCHALCVGETGTGKTMTVTDKLTNHMDKEYKSIFITLSAQTSVNQLQDMMDAKLEKRRKGVYGPPSGSKFVVSVDDMNMPKREKYHAQPPIELLRQWMDHGGWYERKPPCQFKSVVDLAFVGCMAPPGGGRNPVTSRYLRHFNMLGFTELSNGSVRRIFSTIMEASWALNFPKEIVTMIGGLVQGTIDLYDGVKKKLLPTPAKSHYTFNLRDIARVVQGMLRAEPCHALEGGAEILALWAHENFRVFQDRLINERDRGSFRELLDAQMSKHFGKQLVDLVLSNDNFLFTDIHESQGSSTYQRVSDIQGLQEVVVHRLQEYNSQQNNPMQLEVFPYALQHVSRLTRILKLPQGHGLLLGVGGSGRHSLTKLAAHLEGQHLYSIEISKSYGIPEWKDDLRKVMKIAGLQGQEVTFFIADTQIVRESFLEDLNNMLNSGDVPNLMKGDDMEEINQVYQPRLQSMGLATDKNTVYKAFVNRVKENLHIIIAMSPVGSAFKTRLRMFPSLVNCCTIDWFDEWPMKALQSVAKSYFQSLELEAGLLGKAIDFCVHVHMSVAKVSKQFIAERGRYNYVTPTSYLELLQTFAKLLAQKKTGILDMRKRFQSGLDKLSSTSAKVADMEKNLQELQPKLKQSSTEVEELMSIIEKDTKEGEVTRQGVKKQEEEAEKQAQEAQIIAESAQADLDKALPALDAAVASLKKLSRNDIVEIKALKNPPAGVKLVMEACCKFFQLKPKMVPDTRRGAKPGAKVPDYWEASSKMLADPTAFLDSLMKYDKDNIPPQVITKIEPYIQRSDFTQEAISKVSKACTSICLWARAMYTYHQVTVEVEPKRQALKEAQEKHSVTLGELEEAKEKLHAVESKLAELDDKFREADRKRQDLENQANTCKIHLERAGKLIGGLGGEKIRWQQFVDRFTEDLKNVVGDVLLSSAVVAYQGAFTPSYRKILFEKWELCLNQVGILHSQNTSIARTLGDPVTIQCWNAGGLPADDISIENAIIVANSRRWPLMIDPQGQASRWIRNMEKDDGLEVIKVTDKDFLRSLSNCIRFGRIVLLEDIQETLDPSLEPLLLRQTFKHGGGEAIKLGEDIIPYHPNFRLYMTTKLTNPHYPPELCVKVTLLNFFVTNEGLEEQLLSVTVEAERAELAEKKRFLVLNNSKMKKQLKDIEDRILVLLSNSEGNILDDEELINTLAQSKTTSKEIEARVEEAEKAEKEIDSAREQYRPVARRASSLFFCISNFASIDPMYQNSLPWFATLFTKTMKEAKPATDITERILILQEAFMQNVYSSVCRSLFAKHKLLLSLLLAIEVFKDKGEFDAQEWKFLLTGATEACTTTDRPQREWCTEKVWSEILCLSKLPHFSGLSTSMLDYIDSFDVYFDSLEPHRFSLPGGWDEKLSSFQKLLVLRCLRPDKITKGIEDFVVSTIGEQYIESPTFNLRESYAESSPMVPLIFIVSSGTDPMADLLKLSEELGMSESFVQVSLGQGQGPKAEALLKESMQLGRWICLQNCHLAKSWMASLELLVESMDAESIHKDFRLWLTSMPSPHFPPSILQRGIKMALEPPKGLKANLLRSFSRVDLGNKLSGAEGHKWKQLAYSICAFHAVIQERKKFGPLGWNIRYSFTDGDLEVCQKQIQLLLRQCKDVPFAVIQFLCGEINYGGRVTDEKDRRLLRSLLRKFINPNILKPGHFFDDAEAYSIPACNTEEEYREHIQNLPLVSSPDIFGLHENADITCDQNETYSLFDTVLSLLPSYKGTEGSDESDTVEGTALDLLARCPPPIDMLAVRRKYPTRYEESMNTVLVQECIRYNGLIHVIQTSLTECLKALRGQVSMSSELEELVNSIDKNQVPELWSTKSYPSLKPLSAWFADLAERLSFIRGWIENGLPKVVWFTGFFFPQAFLTGLLQNYARKHKVAIDQVTFEYQVMDTMPSDAVVPNDGHYIHGLYLEGASWDSESHCLCEQKPKELFTPMPVIWLKPTHKPHTAIGEVYACPTYKILSRSGTLSTTGHSTNFIMDISLPTRVPASHWIDRGVALFTQLLF